jgi:hypothetical protein
MYGDPPGARRGTAGRPVARLLCMHRSSQRRCRAARLRRVHAARSGRRDSVRQAGVVPRYASQRRVRRTSSCTWASAVAAQAKDEARRRAKPRRGAGRRQPRRGRRSAAPAGRPLVGGRACGRAGARRQRALRCRRTHRSKVLPQRHAGSGAAGEQRKYAQQAAAAGRGGARRRPCRGPCAGRPPPVVAPRLAMGQARGALVGGVRAAGRRLEGGRRLRQEGRARSAVGAEP